MGGRVGAHAVTNFKFMVMNMFRESYANKYTPPTNSYMNTLKQA